MRALIVGDVHGDFAGLAECLHWAVAEHAVSVAIQVGDFGFSRDRIERWSANPQPFVIPVFAIDGNREDHAWLRRCRQNGAVEVWRESLNLFYQPRPSIAQIGGTCVGFLGGALHVHRRQEHRVFSGSPNYIDTTQLARAIALFNRQAPRLLVTHSCPAGIGVGLRGDPSLKLSVVNYVVDAGFDPGPADDRGETALRQLWEQLSERPSAWVFGHFHRQHRAVVGDTQFVCAGALEWPATVGQTMFCWDSESTRIETIHYGVPPVARATMMSAV